MKKALKIFVNVLAWALLILAFLVTLLVFSSERNNGIPSLFGYMTMTVETDSMKPTFSSGDLIIVKEVDLMDLKKDDVITYYTVIDGTRARNTHRIVEVINDNGKISFITRGDNNPGNDEGEVIAGDVIGKWTKGRVIGGGKAMNFLRTKKGFFICIVIPMAIFFLIELYKFIVTLIEVRKPSMTEAEEEEIKRKAVEEYLAKQAQAGANEETEKTANAVESAAASVIEDAGSLAGSAEEAVAEAKEAAGDLADASADKE